MAGINKVILVGNLGQKPEVKYGTSGNAMASLSVATSESWKDKNTGEKQEKPKENSKNIEKAKKKAQTTKNALKMPKKRPKTANFAKNR